jgi:pyruvate-formate lyase-activating enzyme
MLRETFSSSYRWSLAKLAPYSSKAHKTFAQIELREFFDHVSYHNFRLDQAGLDELENKIRALSLEQVTAFFPFDPWGTNFLTNLWEYTHGVAELNSYPWNISLPVADVCNARCTFCTSWLEGREILDLKQLDRFTSVLRNAVYVGLVGHGEPMAHPEFDILCTKLAGVLDRRAQCYTITNGFFLEKWRDHLETINLHSYSISLNAATPETHDAVMGLGLEAFRKIVSSLEHLVDLSRRKGLGLQIFITLVVTQQNIHEIPAFIELGNRLGVTGVWLRTLLPQAGLLSGLNYHVLPPYLHPEFPLLLEQAREAIAASRVPVQADPDVWKNRLFSPQTEELIEIHPPPTVSREEGLRLKEVRDTAARLYDMPVTKGLPLAPGSQGTIDPLEDGLNPMNRYPRFACKAVYYNLYINEFFFRLNPCCYIQQIPGFEEIRFDGSYDFLNAWNSPAMIELRRRLNHGPLFGACKRCPEKW